MAGPGKVHLHASVLSTLEKCGGLASEQDQVMLHVKSKGSMGWQPTAVISMTARVFDSGMVRLCFRRKALTGDHVLFHSLDLHPDGGVLESQGIPPESIEGRHHFRPQTNRQWKNSDEIPCRSCGKLKSNMIHSPMV